MTRTPDEIKKGLECCKLSFIFHECGSRCPYFREGSCGVKLFSDALALIQQLQDENAQLNRCIENMVDKLNAMNDEVAKLQAERDAVMRDMTKNCDSCKYAGFNNPGSDGCPYVEQCQNYVKWQWRGVTKEDGNASD